MEIYKVISGSPEEIKYYMVYKEVWYRCTNTKGRKRISFASDPTKKATMLGWKVPEITQSSPLELLVVMNLSQGQVIEWIEFMEHIKHSSSSSLLREGFYFSDG